MAVEESLDEAGLGLPEVEECLVKHPAVALAGVTGAILTLVVPSIDPNGGVDLALIGFIVIVLGGLGPPVGALIAGMIFGVVEQVSNVMLPQAAAQMVGFVILIAVIFVRPSGLFGVRIRR